MKDKSLGSSAYVVLGLTLQHGEISPYELKQRIANSVGYFWPFSHPQIYAVTARLQDEGLMSHRQEETGRRRRLYKLTRKGRTAFQKWLASPVDSHPELRDLALIKLYFGEHSNSQTIKDMADAQVATHAERLRLYQNIPKQRSLNEFATKTLELGIEFEKMSKRYWTKVAKEHDK